MEKIKKFLKGPIFGTLVCFAAAAVLFVGAGKFSDSVFDIYGGTAFLILGIIYFIACKVNKE